VSGVVEGGWGFVVAAYLVTALALGGYATSVFLRYRAETRRAARDARKESHG
jgi:hypothetical protein